MASRTAGIAAALLFSALAVTGCSPGKGPAAQARGVADHSSHAMSESDTVTTPDDTTLPADANHALARLNASPRHGQYVMIPRRANGKSGDSLRAYVVYPSRNSQAPVVVVIHEIFGMSTWVRAVADQLAQAGYIAVAPDLLSGQSLPGAPDSVPTQAAVAAVSKLAPDQVMADVDAAANWAMAQPAALKKYGVVGFCWGGGMAFRYAAHAPTLGAAVVYYGEALAPNNVPLVRAPVLGNYAGNDARVTSTIPPTDSAFKAQHKTFEYHIYDGAAHGFARAQGPDGSANRKAIQAAWPATIAWFRHYLGT
jgi:carboxymethylenebutenolidase